MKASNVHATGAGPADFGFVFPAGGKNEWGRPFRMISNSRQFE
jgi:hypothetical protein